MDVTFIRESGDSFTMELGHSETFLEVKKKIEKHRNIPISKQLFFFNDQLLQDDQIIWLSGVTDASTIHLHLTSDPPIRIQVQLYKSESSFPLEINLNNTVLQLKHKIHEVYTYIPVNEMSVQFSSFKGDHVFNNQSMQELRVSNNSIVYVFTVKNFLEPKKAPVATLPPVPKFSTSSRKLSLNVVPMAIRGKDDFIVDDIESCAEVSELRKFLECYNSSVLPEDRRYFFIHNQSVMHEGKSFQWHGVEDGDTIELFDGHVVDT